MKKVTILIISFFMILSSQAQWKVSSVDNTTNDQNKILQIIETDESIFIYGTFDKPVTEQEHYCIDRKTKVEVNGESYKIKNSINLPLYDDAEKKWALFRPENHKLNYVIEFEKFPVTDGFSIIGNKSGDKVLDITNEGIHIEKIDSSKLLNTGRFLDNGTPMYIGNFSKDGNDFVYYINDNVSFTFHVSLSNKNLLYYIDIVNKSDHGVNFKIENVNVLAVKEKDDDQKEEFYLTRYSPESFEEYFQKKDYEEAKEAVGGMLEVSDQIDRTGMANSKYGTWERLGWDFLSSLAKQSGENSIKEYMEANPKEHPQALKSNGVKPGETYQGYVAFKYKKSNSQELRFKVEDYEYTVRSTFTK